MGWDKTVKSFQVIAAALGIPAAAAGSYSAYKGYFSNDATCERLRGTILSTMEKNIPATAKHTLLRKDVAEFDKLCGASDPDARAIFEAALQETEAPPAAATAAHASSGNIAGGTAPATAGGAAGARQTVAVFGAAGSPHQHGWVIVSRKDDNGWVSNFSGHAGQDGALPPAGTLLTAQHLVPVWEESFVGKNDRGKLQSRLPTGACVRVVATHGAPARTWAEVVPASCS